MAPYRKWEPWLVVAGTSVVGGLSPVLPDAVRVGTLAAGLGVALLLQGLVRDLFTLAEQARARRRGEPAAAAEHRACMCLESIVGLPLILAGVALTMAFTDDIVRMAPWSWPLLAGVVFGTGYLIRDWVVEWRPRWRVAQVKNHGAILVQWKGR
jgi:hypothetical protein